MEGVRTHELTKARIKILAEELAEEFARSFYSKLVIAKYMPEIRAVESGKLKALRGREIHKFLQRSK